jgi:hypothetical protein
MATSQNRRQEGCKNLTDGEMSQRVALLLGPNLPWGRISHDKLWLRGGDCPLALQRVGKHALQRVGKLAVWTDILEELIVHHCIAIQHDSLVMLSKVTQFQITKYELTGAN